MTHKTTSRNTYVPILSFLRKELKREFATICKTKCKFLLRLLMRITHVGKERRHELRGSRLTTKSLNRVTQAFNVLSRLICSYFYWLPDNLSMPTKRLKGCLVYQGLRASGKRSHKATPRYIVRLHYFSDTLTPPTKRQNSKQNKVWE